jgi:hypothetical protein
MDDIIANLAGPFGAYPDSYEYKLINLAADGDVVLTERLDMIRTPRAYKACRSWARSSSKTARAPAGASADYQVTDLQLLRRGLPRRGQASSSSSTQAVLLRGDVPHQRQALEAEQRTVGLKEVNSFGEAVTRDALVE